MIITLHFELQGIVLAVFQSIYIYIYVCVCVCLFQRYFKSPAVMNHEGPYVRLEDGRHRDAMQRNQTLVPQIEQKM